MAILKNTAHKNIDVCLKSFILLHLFALLMISSNWFQKYVLAICTANFHESLWLNAIVIFISLSNSFQQLLRISLLWRHSGRECVSNYRRLDCILNRLFRRRWKETSKLCVTGLCEGNSPVTSEFPSQSSNKAENVSIWWRHHDYASHVCGINTVQMLIQFHRECLKIIFALHVF